MDGLASNTLESIAYQCNPSPAPSRHPPGEKDQRVPGCFHYNSGNATKHPEVRTMPSCVACGAELEPPVRTPHTVYVKSLYRIAGQDYCRHHIIRAAVVAGVINEVNPGVIPAGASDTVSSSRTNGFTKNVLSRRGSRQSRGRQSDASPIRSAVPSAAAAARLGRWADGPGAAAGSYRRQTRTRDRRGAHQSQNHWRTAQSTGHATHSTAVGPGPS